MENGSVDPHYVITLSGKMEIASNMRNSKTIFCEKCFNYEIWINTYNSGVYGHRHADLTIEGLDYIHCFHIKMVIIALNLPVWWTPSGIYCIEGPSEICTQSAEVRLAVSGAQPLFTLGLLMFALSLVDFLSLLLSPSTYFNIFYFCQKYHLNNTYKIFKNFMLV